MGYASYFEDIADRALDRAMMLAAHEDKFCFEQARETPPPLPKRIITLAAPEASRAQIEQARIEKRIRDLQAVNILAMLELRPSPRHHY
ncbi:hypothetical protein AB7828_21880 [Tardiphaga sp. 215_C5_N2_1]|jgi:hypothetical protein|uniref:hypothetical protein n=1 Tax=Tardiphaga sp. 215_C5_N2_1 TaxID=3240774 RepID=UPI003F8CD028